MTIENTPNYLKEEYEIFQTPSNPLSIYKSDVYHDKYYDKFQLHQGNHWTKRELTGISEDIVDFSTLTHEEQELIFNILRVFTQADSSVLDGYSHLIRVISPLSMKMMLSDFLAREAVHIDAYSHFTDSLGVDPKFYSEFLNVPEMNDKFIFIESAKIRPYNYYLEKHNGDQDAATFEYRQDILYMMCVYSLLVEGVELFAMFSILFSFRFFKGKMRTLATIVEWSID